MDRVFVLQVIAMSYDIFMWRTAPLCGGACIGLAA